MTEQELLKELCEKFTSDVNCVGIERVRGIIGDTPRYFGEKGKKYYDINITCDTLAQYKNLDEILKGEGEVK